MTNDYTLTKYLHSNVSATCVARKDTPHKVLKDADPIRVYVDREVLSNGRVKTYFSLFYGEKFIGNSMIFNQEVPSTYYAYIGNAMINELLEASDFRDLDRELEGKCACEEYEGIYKSCDECPKYRYREKMGSATDSCIGAMYSIPTHMNIWKCEDTFLKAFGEGTEFYESYEMSLVTNHLAEIRNIYKKGINDKEIKRQLKTLLRTM